MNELSEYTHLAFTQIAASAENRFSTWIPQAVQAAINSINAEDGALKGQASPSKSIDLGSDELRSDDDEDHDEDQYDVHTGCSSLPCMWFLPHWGHKTLLEAIRR